MGDSAFLAGYGAAQAVPGPLFTLSAYLGAIATPQRSITGATLALIAIFAPGLLLIAGALPFRRAVADSRYARAAIAGVNARSEEHTSELQSLMRISYAVFCLKKKKNIEI